MSMILTAPAQPIVIRQVIARGPLWHRVALFLMGHVALALVMFQYEAVATLHAGLTLLVGLWWAIGRKLDRVAYCGAYIVGAEVLWRMTDAQVPWEFGKYAMSFIFLVALARTGRLGRPILPALYFLLLLPSIWITFANYPMDQAVRQVSFNMSGPFTLFVGAWFFQRLTLTQDRFLVLLIALLGPVLGIAANAIFNTISVEHINFTSESNSITSGGFGPNQAAAILGLGVVAAFFYLTNGPSRLLHRALIGGIMLVLVFQSGLTFSRTGLALAAGSIVLATFFLVRNGRMRLVILLLAVIGFLFVRYIMVPALDDFTRGYFSHRFTETTSSGRFEAALVDLQIWERNLVLGAGPGGGGIQRTSMGLVTAAHTEFTRMLGEHGMLGMFALVVFIIMCIRNILRAQGFRNRAVAVAFLGWATAFMLVSGLRLAAPGLVFGLTFAVLHLDAIVQRSAYLKRFATGA